ncbi:MAG: hypothetical protein AB9836_07575 [Aminipila sp.]
MGGISNTDKNITLDDFIKKSVERYNNRKMVVNLEVNGDLIPFNRPSEYDLLRYIDDTARAIEWDSDGKYTGQDSSKMFESSRDFVYATCKFMQDKELQKVFEVTEPTDVVVKICGVEGTLELAAKIKEAFDGDRLATEVDNIIKN